MRTVIAIVMVGLAGVLWTSPRADQQTLQPQANQGPGIVTIAGTVHVGNTPSVHAGQLGEWKVAIANTPSVAVAGPQFLALRGNYEVTWSDGTRESVVVEQLGRDGWVRVASARWINLALARSVQVRQ